MNELRQNLVQKVFEKLDIKKTGEITFKELGINYCTKNHPDVLSGKISEEEALKEFEDTFQETIIFVEQELKQMILLLYKNSWNIMKMFRLLLRKMNTLNNTWNLGLNVKYKNEIKPKQIEENIEEKNIEQTNEEINTKMKEH